MVSPVNKPTGSCGEQGLFVLLASFFLLSAVVVAYTGNYLWLAVPFAGLLFYTGWQYRNAVFFLLLFSLPFSVEFGISGTLGTDLPDEFLMVIVTILFIAYCCYRPSVLAKDTLQHPLLLLLLVWLCWTILTVVCSSQPLISIKYLFAKGWYLGAFVAAPLILFKEKKQIRLAALSLVTALMIVVLISLVRHAGNNFSFETINQAVSPFFRNHVNYSAMLVCGIPILFAFYRLSRSGYQKSYILFLIILALAALFFAYSRGAWLALLVGLLSYGLIRIKFLLSSYIIIILLAVAALFWLKSGDRYLRYAPDFKTTIFHKNFREHLTATYTLKDVSTAERFYRWIAAVRMIKDEPLTGRGPNTFYTSYKPYTVPAYKTWVSDNPDQSTVHNYFLLLATEQGIPGLVFFLVLLGAMLYYAQYLYQKITDVFYRTLAITTGVILVMITVLNTLSDLIETDKIGSLFFLSLSILIVIDTNSGEEKKRRKSSAQPNHKP